MCICFPELQPSPKCITGNKSHNPSIKVKTIMLKSILSLTHAYFCLRGESGFSHCDLIVLLVPLRVTRIPFLQM